MRLLVIILLLMVTSAHAVDVPFTLSWVGPTKYLGGQPGTAASYKVYACDGVISKPALHVPVSCPGNLQIWDTTGTQLAGSYVTPSSKGYVFFRVTAISELGSESLLSGLVFKRYNTMDVLNMPTGLQLDNNCVNIINNICQ